MGSTADKLQYLGETKVAIHDAIVAKGVSVASGTPFRDYATKIAQISTGSASSWSQSYYDTAYSQMVSDFNSNKPYDWLTLPSLSEYDERVVGLHAVYPSANFCSLVCSGDYTVDWGDGTVENFTSGTQAYHIYDYNTFDIGGTTLCSKGYKQAIVSITPQAGSNLTSVNLHKKHNATNLGVYSSGFLDLVIAGQFLNTLLIGSSILTGSTATIRFNDLARVQILSHALTNMNYVFANCSSLKVVTIANTASVATMVGMFSNCVSMTVAPYFVTTNVTDVSFLFQSCKNMMTVPLYDLSSATNTSYMFQFNSVLELVPQFNTVNARTMDFMFSTCYNLQSMPLLNTASATSMNGFHASCFSLTEVPQYDTTYVTNMTSMFSSCVSLKTVPQFNTPSLIIATGMFSGCSKLKTVPLLNTSAATDTSSMFLNCNALTSAPLFDTSNVTNMSGMFQNCSVLTTIPLLNTAKATNVSNMVSTCLSLQSVPALDFNQVTTAGSIFTGCGQLASISIVNYKATISVANCKLSTGELNNILNNTLSSPATKALTLTSNFGLDTAISKSGTLSLNSNTITMADTSNLSVGMGVMGTGMPYLTVKVATITDQSSTVSLTGHNLSENTMLGLVNFVPTAKTMNATASWSSVAYGASKFVAVASGSSTGGYSTDGTTWTNMTMPSAVGWASLTYGNGIFMAVAGYTVASTVGAISSDGINWTSITMPSQAWNSVCYGNGKFLAVSVYNGSSGITSTYYTSTDNGSSWSAGTFPISANWTTCTYANGQFVVGGTSNTLLVSTDGVSWVSRVVNNSSYFSSIAYGNGVWVATQGYTSIGNVSSTSVAVSTDNGASWANKAMPSANWWASVAYGNGTFVAVAGGRAANSNVGAYSADGINWYSLTMPSTSAWMSVAYGNSIMNAVSGTSASMQLAFSDTNLNFGKLYYAVQVSTNSFSLSETANGYPLTLSVPSGSSKLFFRAGSVITGITPNTSITISAPATAATTTTLTIRPQLDTMKALVKNWTITF
jgi:surface protein